MSSRSESDRAAWENQREGRKSWGRVRAQASRPPAARTCRARWWRTCTCPAWRKLHISLKTCSQRRRHTRKRHHPLQHRLHLKNQTLYTLELAFCLSFFLSFHSIISSFFIFYNPYSIFFQFISLFLFSYPSFFYFLFYHPFFLLFCSSWSCFLHHWLKHDLCALYFFCFLCFYFFFFTTLLTKKLGCCVKCKEKQNAVICKS